MVSVRLGRDSSAAAQFDYAREQANSALPDPTRDTQWGEDTLRFAELTGVRPMVETYPLEKAGEAYTRMLSG